MKRRVEMIPATRPPAGGTESRAGPGPAGQSAAACRDFDESDGKPVS
ncbi:MAG: hypothetical protein LBG24_02980 [Treponema sp.]|nr:hypothetical protein [Treponema sp.]